MMGSPTNEWGRLDDETLHKVVLTKPYYMCIFETTAKQWYNVMGGGLPTEWDGKTCLPCSYNWNTIRGGTWPSSHAVDDNSFMDNLRKRTSLTWDLPTEAQWEYACRAGTTTSLNTGKNVTADTCEAMNEAGCYSGNYSSYGKPAKVGLFLPNNWGLYDMHGNVYEWCLDTYSAATYTLVSYQEFDNSTDPQGWPEHGNTKVVRGGFIGSGSWFNSGAQFCRSACRGSAILYREGYGFRPVILPFD